MAHAGKIVNATEAERLMAEGNHVFVNMADIPKIEKYMHSIANQDSVVYEGTWHV